MLDTESIQGEFSLMEQYIFVCNVLNVCVLSRFLNTVIDRLSGLTKYPLDARFTIL